MQNFVVPVVTVLAAFLGSFAATFLASHPSLARVGVQPRRLGAEQLELSDSSAQEVENLKASQARLEAELKELKQQLAGPRYISIPEVSDADANVPNSTQDRRLSGLFKAATTMATGIGCKGYTTDVTAVDLNSATACDTAICPDCFYFDLATPADVAVTYSNCHTSRWGSYTMGTAPLATAIRSYTFINMMAANKVTVSDGTTTYVVPAKTSMVAYCHTGGATLYYGWNPSQDVGCPKGCDDTTPNDPSGTAFGTAVNFPGSCGSAGGGMTDVCILGR